MQHRNAAAIAVVCACAAALLAPASAEPIDPADIRVIDGDTIAISQSASSTEGEERR